MNNRVHTESQPDHLAAVYFDKQPRQDSYHLHEASTSLLQDSSKFSLNASNPNLLGQVHSFDNQHQSSMRQLPHCSLRQKENVYQPSDTNQQLIKEMLNYSIPQVRDHVRNKASEEFTFEPPRGQTQRISSQRSFYNEEDNRASSEKPDHQCSKRNSSKAKSTVNGQATGAHHSASEETQLGMSKSAR